MPSRFLLSVFNPLSLNIHLQILQTSLYTFPKRISKENLIKGKCIFSQVIIWSILTTYFLDCVLILLWRKYWCLSLLGLKNIVFYFKFILVIPNMTTGCCWTRVSILIWWLTFFAALVDQIIILTLFSWGHYITRHDIYNIIVLCTISWRAGSQKHQLWRAELILLQNRYKKQREKQKKKRKAKRKEKKEYLW